MQKGTWHVQIELFCTSSQYKLWLPKVDNATQYMQAMYESVLKVVSMNIGELSYQLEADRAV